MFCFYEVCLQKLFEYGEQNEVLVKNILHVDYNSVVIEHWSIENNVLREWECILMNFIDGAISIPFT